MAGIIVAPQPLAAEAGLTVLKDGGNAVDAAVTAAFCQGVLDPQMCGIGGCGVMLLHLADGREEVIEFHARAGAKVREDQWEKLFLREAADRYGYVLEGWVNDVGYGSVGIPGTVAGLAEALRRHGTISWADAIGPAIPLARDGVPVSGFVHGYWTTDAGPDACPHDQRVQWTEAARAIFTNGGELKKIGEPLVQADYARTLEHLAAAGPEDFYRGDIAARIAQDFEANGGTLTADDLANYTAEVNPPLRGSYRGLDVVTAGPPVGGLTLLQMLNFLERHDLRRLEWPSVEAARLRIEAMAFAFADRERYLADPKFASVPVERLLDKGYAGAVHDRGETTHLCVIDDAGNAVSMTHTLGAASGVVTQGLGFMYNDYLNCFDPRPGRLSSLAPGKTRWTMISPAIVFDAGRLAAVAGAPGGTKIVTGVLQALINHLDHGMTPVEAVSAPRIDYQGEVVTAEGRMPEAVLEGLRGLGYEVQRRVLNYDSYYARVQLIGRREGSLVGASDPRKDGGVALHA
jgi:gamma-glutamyltranspeptidase/glutathione hydrolase